MLWNWQLPDWPKFSYDRDRMAQKEKKFLMGMGGTLTYLKNMNKEESRQFTLEILSRDGIESARIEGEILDRESLQSSIKRCFGLKHDPKKNQEKEVGMAQLLCSVYEKFETPLTHEVMWKWHEMLFDKRPSIVDCGKYRTHSEPMQIVSSRHDSLKVFFEAPPSSKVPQEMSHFVDWFNATKKSEPPLGRAAIAHIYFESIHPFEDGNGRIGRALIQKILSQGVEQPALISVSTVFEKRKKEYYAALERCNRTLQVEDWVEFFSDAVLQAQEESTLLLRFLIEKSKMLTALAAHLNPRQEKVLLRMFSEGPSGFKGGLSAENYISIAGTSRATATRDLAQLVQLGALVKTGELRHTRYWLPFSLNSGSSVVKNG